MNVDFSAFDSSVPKFLIDRAFGIVKGMLDLTHDEEVMLSELCNYFVYTPIALYNEVRTKFKGIPSGSAFTQLIGSIVNMIACHYAALSYESNIELVSRFSCWLGDDSYLVFSYMRERSFMMGKFLDRFQDLCLTANPDKTEYGLVNQRNPCELTFLGMRRKADIRVWTVDFIKLEAQIMLPEFKDKHPSDTLERVVGLMWTYGFNEVAYRRLLKAGVECLRQGAAFPEVPINKNLRHFSYLGFLNHENFRKFPLLQEIESRYYGTFLDALSWLPNLSPDSALLDVVY